MQPATTPPTVPLVLDGMPSLDSILELFPFAQSPNEYASFDLKTEEGSNGYLIALSSEATQLKSHVNLIVEITQVIVRAVEMVSAESGEVLVANRAIMIDPDGQAFSTTSPSVIRMLASVMKTRYGRPPWNPPMRFKAILQRTAAGRDCLNFVPLVGSPPVKTEKPAKKP